jgi:hydroxyethylthiazole kinase-like uncharacterized protein yjeF
MRPVLTGEEYRRVDKAFTGDLAEAMERAGHAVALAAARHGAGYGKRVVVLAGPGNNGGDGYVAARHLRTRGAAVEVQALAAPVTDLARAAADRALAAGVVIRELEVVDTDLVIDAVFGGGSRDGIPSGVLAWMDTPAPVVAVDYPTGLDPDSGAVAERAFRAVETVTFGCLKTGHLLRGGPDHCGMLTVADIGISGGEPSLFVAEAGDAPRPARSRTTHKWAAGSVLVIGGSPGLAGAAILTGRAALAFGAGTVYLTSPDRQASQTAAPELPTYDLDQAREHLDRFDVVVAGPGLAEADQEMARELVTGARRVVLDAGGLTPELIEAARAGDAEVVITPHNAEFARVAGVSAGTFSIRSFAMRKGVTVLRKGNPTMVTDGGLPVLVRTGGPELASIGTGDVLAGMLGALWARGLSGRDAAISAAYWHGVAGADLAARGSLTADRLARHIRKFAW